MSREGVRVEKERVERSASRELSKERVERSASRELSKERVERSASREISIERVERQRQSREKQTERDRVETDV